jgi:hypothetical protein
VSVDAGGFDDLGQVRCLENVPLTPHCRGALRLARDGEDQYLRLAAEPAAGTESALLPDNLPHPTQSPVVEEFMGNAVPDFRPGGPAPETGTVFGCEFWHTELLQLVEGHGGVLFGGSTSASRVMVGPRRIKIDRLEAAGALFER